MEKLKSAGTFKRYNVVIINDVLTSLNPVDDV